MLTEILLLIVTTLIGYYLYVYKTIHNHFKDKDVKYLPGVPFFGNAFKSTVLKRHMIDDLDVVYRAFPGERYVGYMEGISPIILIRDPELMKMITVRDFDHFINHKELFVPEELFAQSLIMMKDAKWRDMRTTLSPAFTGSKMKMMMPFLQEISKNLVEYLKDQIGQDIDVDDVTHRFTTDVIASAAFGLEVNSFRDKDNKFFMMGQTLFQFTPLQRAEHFFCSQFPGITKKLGLGVPRTTKLSKFFMDIASTTMEFREKNNVMRPDMVQLLMEAYKGTLKSSSNVEKDNVGFATNADDYEQGSSSRQWTQVELASQLFTFFVAGFESSSATLTMCLHELAIHPDIQETLYQEVKEFKERQSLNFENVKELKYLDSVLNETFRKWSVAIVMDRFCSKTYDLPPAHEGGKPYTLNPGDVIYNVVNAIHMDPAYYPDPEIFNPDRFSEDNKEKIKPFTFMPFGMGPRACLGIRFALLELKVFLFDMISNFKILKFEKTTEPLTLQPVDFNIKAIGGTWVRLEARK